MSEEQKIDKPKLPTKTKIAVWWLVVVGVALIIFNFLALGASIIFSFDSGPTEGIQPAFILFFGSIFYPISAIFISRRTKSTWIIAVIMLLTIAAFSLGAYIAIADVYWPAFLLVGIIIYLTPIILIVLDRKKFLEMVRLRDLAEHYYINRNVIVGLFLLTALFSLYCWAIFKLPELQNVELSIYKDAKGDVQAAVNLYRHEHNGALPTSGDTVIINGKDYAIIDLCLASVHYSPECWAVAIDGPNNDNCDGGCGWCEPTWNYIWAVDNNGKVHTTCLGDECNAHNEDGFQGPQ